MDNVQKHDNCVNIYVLSSQALSSSKETNKCYALEIFLSFKGKEIRFKLL
jgi:hypothetical protein